MGKVSTIELPNTLSDYPTMESILDIGSAYRIKVRRRAELLLLECIDEGYFSLVFRVSKYRILKVFMIPVDDVFWHELLIDEIEGSRRLKRALPILGLWGVYIPRYDRDGALHVGVYKRYLPLEITKKEASRVRKKSEPDCKRENFRKDYAGNIYRVDTQMLSFM